MISFRPDVWLVVFHDTDEKRWWDYLFFTRDNFRHCYAITYDPQADKWMYFDPYLDRFDIRVVEPEDAVTMLGLAKTRKNARILSVPCKKHPVSSEITLIYCVSAIKKLVGLSSFWTLTPYAFYFKLKANGATVYANDEGKKVAWVVYLARKVMLQKKILKQNVVAKLKKLNNKLKKSVKIMLRLKS